MRDIPAIGQLNVRVLSAFALDVDGLDVAAQEPGKLPWVLAVFFGVAVVAVAFAALDDQGAFFWPDVRADVVVLVARHLVE